MNRTEKIEKLRQRMEALQKTIDDLTYAPACPVCGGDVRKSTKSDTYFCEQQHGHCGILVLCNASEKQQGHGYSARFSVTSVSKGHKVTTAIPDNPFQMFYFGGGHQVEKEDYFVEGK